MSASQRYQAAKCTLPSIGIHYHLLQADLFALAGQVAAEFGMEGNPGHKDFECPNGRFVIFKLIHTDPAGFIVYQDWISKGWIR